MTDEEILAAYTFLANKSRFFVRPPPPHRWRVSSRPVCPRAPKSCACSTGHGLKDPDLAISQISVPTVVDLNLETILAELSL